VHVFHALDRNCYKSQTCGHDRPSAKAPLERELSIDLPGIRRLKLAINSGD
jgi:hypothetical protein